MNILFATMPFDGHFNPLTGIAVHLKECGHDVRWYCGQSYAPKLAKLGIPHFVYKRAREINSDNVAEFFPERAKLSGMALIKFEGRHIFIGNVANHFEDIREIDAEFSFHVLICDIAFFAMKLVKEKLGKRAYAVDVATSNESDKHVPPNFVGLKPANNAVGRLLHQGMRVMMDKMSLGDATSDFNAMLAAQGLAPIKGPLLDVPYRSPDLVFASGVPGFAYPRNQPNPKVKFVGALLPYKAAISRAFSQANKLEKYKTVILISQGTVDNKDPNKLIVPALEALKDSGALLVVATGHSKTAELRKLYPQDNIVIEDFVDFDFIFDHTDVFVCNGGYGSVMLALSHGVPLLVAGEREGKNDVNAHVDYFKAGIDLRTEATKPEHIRRGVERLLSEPQWKQNVVRLRDEFSRYQPFELIDASLAGDMAHQHTHESEAALFAYPMPIRGRPSHTCQRTAPSAPALCPSCPRCCGCRRDR
jgi:UDP:flavonoid glycosyltransferase YjiC (YdhE family)